MGPKEYYSRKEVKERMLESAKDREFSARYGDGGFGKRPGVAQFENDIQELANQGATSFHVSEELWHNPLDLEAGMVQNKLDLLRMGWDLILDIDCVCFEYSRITAHLLVEALKFHNVKSISVKFSGNKGMHIGVPFKAFPKEINGQKIEHIFPEAPRIIANYLEQMIKDALSANILELSNEDLEIVERNSGKKKEEFLVDGLFDPFKIVDIDTILISNRHMFRAPYSLHEKSGLASVPIPLDKVSKFRKEEAMPEKIGFGLRFLEDRDVEEGEARQLFMQAFDWHKRNQPVEEVKKKLTYEEIKDQIPEEYFPPCISSLLEGIKEDGRKRALFVLMNFLGKTGHSYEAIDELVHKWNEKNGQPLKEGYIMAQLSWYKRNKSLLPPNCDNNAYYTSMLVCKPDNFCSKIKNPVHYAIRKQKITNFNKKKPRKRAKKKDL